MGPHPQNTMQPTNLTILKEKTFVSKYTTHIPAKCPVIKIFKNPLILLSTSTLWSTPQSAHFPCTNNSRTPWIAAYELKPLAMVLFFVLVNIYFFLHVGCSELEKVFF